MKESKFLRGICYVLIPIMIFLIAFSFFYELHRNYIDNNESYYIVEDEYGNIYYQEENNEYLLAISSNEKEMLDLLSSMTFMNGLAPIIVPVATLILLCMLIFLVISIGHTRGKEEIDLNDLDRIPYEIVFLISGIIASGVIAVLEYTAYNEYELSLNMLIGNWTMAYLASYVIILLNVVTLVKRIKAKTLISSTILGMICKWCYVRLKKVKEEVYDNSSMTVKLIFGVILYIIAIFALPSILDGLGIILLFGLTIWIFYEIIRRINGIKNIEKQLELIYDGKRPENLKKENFTKDYYNMVSYVNDISNGFENAVEQGIKSERLKAELITNVSHDIKTPLTSIINYVDLLKNENIESEKAKEYIEILDNKSQRLKKLIQDLVEASKASSGNIKLNLENLSLSELINQSIGEFEDKFEEKKLSIIKNIPEKDIIIKADSRYMYRIIENLFENITKYALENSRVYIDISYAKENKVKVEFKNISKEKLNITEEELMQRFVRGEKSRTTEGNGLGLSISQSLTEIQGGEFKIVIDGDLFKAELEFEIEKNK